MLWNATDNLYNSVEIGNYVRAHGTTQIYNGAMQMIMTRVEPADLREIDEEDFVTVSSADTERLAQRTAEAAHP